jgi:hypothetical protein
MIEDKDSKVAKAANAKKITAGFVLCTCVPP